MKSFLMPLCLLSLLVAAYLAVITAPAAAADTIGFVETFALAEDRAKALEQLIPGTESYYFYHALHYQNSGQDGKLKDILAKWRKRVKSSGLRNLIERRERLFAYDRDPKGTLDWLRHELGIHFSHQREKAPGQKPNLPTRLDPKSITRAAFIRRATSNNNNLNAFQNSALDWILREGGVDLNSGRRRALLARLDRPDYDKLVELTRQIRDSPSCGSRPELARPACRSLGGRDERATHGGDRSSARRHPRAESSRAPSFGRHSNYYCSMWRGG
jgi:uncharacterized protein (DUF1778 family)